MTWLWVLVGVVGYVFVGFLINAFMSGYDENVFVETPDPILIVFWPVVIFFYFTFDGIGKLFDAVRNLGEKTRERKDERK
jgi:hypothetical protein